MITYREARPSDTDRIVEFQLAMARETEHFELDGAVCTRGVRALFDDQDKGRYYLAESGGEVIGSLMITTEWSDWRAGTVWWIQSVYVDPAHRKKGVYGGLYGHVKGLMDRNPDIRGIRLYVDRRNTRAQEVYRRLGMNGDHYQVFEWMKES